MKRLFNLIVTLITLFLWTSCENLVEEEGPIEYSKPSSVEVSASNSRESLDITLTASPNGQSVKSVASASFAYSLSEDLADATTVNATASGDAFTATFRSLDYGKRLYFQATIVSSLGSQMTSSVWNILVPTFGEFVKVSAPELVEAASSSLTLKAEYQSVEGIAIAERGFCWSTELAVPSIENNRVIAESGFQTAIEGLEQMQTINARAYVKDVSGNIAYSEVGQFTTDAVHVSEVSLNKTELQLNEGESQTLVATVKPDDAANQAVSWKSSDTGVATVDANGKVTAVKAGKATITVTSEDGGKTATCEVTVKALVGGIELNKTSLTLNEGASETLTATVKPENASNKNVGWKSSDTSVATVDANGKVTAVKAGTATITVTTEDGGKTATCEVTVIAPVVSISLNKTTLSLTEGSTETLTVTFKPENASNKNVTWKSSDTSVASVDENGKITAVKAGTATITVTTEDGGKTATCAVTVTKAAVHVTGVSLNSTQLSLTVGDQATLTATVSPSNADNKSVTWSSSNSGVASVSNGVVSAESAGTATITVKTADGGKTATCSVTVKAATVSVTGVALNKTSLSLTEGESQTITATVSPSNATNKSVTWKSSNTSVATVDASGKVTAVKAGSATITVTTVDGGKTATCSVTVKNEVKSLSFAVYINAASYLDKSLNIKAPAASSGLMYFSGLVDAAKIGSWTASKTNSPQNVVFNVRFYDSSRNVITSASKYGTATYYEVYTDDITRFYDEGTYSQTLMTYDSSNNLVQTINLDVTKIMPSESKSVSFRAQMETYDGSNMFMAYLTPSSGNTGTIDFADVFYGMSDEHYIFTVENASYNSSTFSSESVVVKYSNAGQSYDLNVDARYIDGQTIHKIKVSYDYGTISATRAMGGGTDVRRYVVDSNQEIKTVFSCWHAAETYSWKNKPELKWTSSGHGYSVVFSDIIAHSQTLGNLSLSDLVNYGWISDLKAELLLNNSKSPYFASSVQGSEIVISQISTQSSSAPAGDHSERLRITAQDTFGHTLTIELDVTCKVEASSSTAEYVDLGLSVKWATCNLGASKPEEYGLYYQWGDTQGYGSDTSDGKYFDFSDENGNITYKWCNGSSYTLTKYNTDSSYGPVVDNKTVLDPADDAAHVALGGKWRMPTYAEWEELIYKCTWVWTAINGINGFRVTSRKSGYTDKSIFLPAAGYRVSDHLNFFGSNGYYWSSSLDTGSPLNAYEVYFSSSIVGRMGSRRYYGHSIRPVSE